MVRRPVSMLGVAELSKSFVEVPMTESLGDFRYRANPSRRSDSDRTSAQLRAKERALETPDAQHPLRVMQQSRARLKDCEQIARVPMIVSSNIRKF